MNRFLYRVMLLLFLEVGWSVAKGQNARFVNPFIGTGKCDVPTLWGNYGGTFPGAVAPWGMLQLTPETSNRPSEKGYYYEDSSIRSFSCVHHLSGYPNGSAGRIHFYFCNGKTDCLPDDFTGRSFFHADERAEPGYYSVTFAEGDRVEMTTATRAGMFRYYPSSQEATVVLWDAGKLKVKDRKTVEAGFMHAYICFAYPFDSFELRADTAYFHFSGKQIERGIPVMLSVSSSDVEGSRKNLVAEIPDGGFDVLRKKTYEQWDRELSCVSVHSEQSDYVIQFYTALYHSFLFPNIISDADGRYKGKRIGQHNMYGNFSPWDTFRTLHPLLSLLKPERQKDMIRSLMVEYAENGDFPKAPMTGLHYIPIIVDACLKGVAGVDRQQIWEALTTYQDKESAFLCRQEYLNQGFVEASQEKSVSITTEYAYDDWVMGRLAQNMGNESASYFRRSLNYRNLFDAASRFLLPRQGGLFLREAGELGFQESNKWTASYFVPHNVADLIHLCGGDSCFVTQLKEGFELGKIHFDNEPVFHYPYLFTWAGRPDLTRQYVHQILLENYRNTPGGLPGNDDLGAMSSWFVFSAMGVFPACPASGEYLLTEPLFDEIRIHCSDKDCVKIVKSGPPHVGLSSVRLGREMIRRRFVSHQEWMEKKVVSFEAPDIEGNMFSFQFPYSLTTGKPDFSVSAVGPVLSSVYSGTVNRLPFCVRNHGEPGTYVAKIQLDGMNIATKPIFLDSEEEKTDTLTFTLYKKGIHVCSFEENCFSIQVVDSVRKGMPLVCTAIVAPSLWEVDDSSRVAFTCKNVSGGKTFQRIPVYLDDFPVHWLELSLEAGEEAEVCIPLSVKKTGMHRVRLLDKEVKIKSYVHALETCLLDLDFGKRNGMQVFDQSGFGNDGIGHGDLIWSEHYVQTGNQAYITFPTSASLMEARDSLTLLTWIAPQSPIEEHVYADFFTKGDYTLMKMEGPETLVFFAGGWGRGMCEIPVPADWYTVWHQIAGVCTGHSLKIYIDGRLMQEVEVAGKIDATELPWNLGRNAEMPFSRFSDMRFSKTRIYGTTLSDEDIWILYAQEKDTYR